MADLAASGEELQTLLQITSVLSAPSNDAQCLDAVFADIGKLVPFEKGILMHERDTQDDTATVIHEFPQGSRATTRTGAQYTRSLLVARHLAHFQRVETFQSAFFWRVAPENSDATSLRTADLIQRMQLTHGAAGLINSAEWSMGRIATLLQLQCDGAELPAKHLFFVNIIAFYLHVWLVHRSTELFASTVARGLTAREKQVLQWIGGGKTSWEVGRILSMSERTVKFHLQNIYAKLNVANRAQAVSAASRMQLI
jgi:LuxR family quorum-sensing system transcriptional regulator SolR